MAGLSNASNDEAGWICLAILEATAEVETVAREFRAWYLTILDRWEAEEKAEQGAAQ